VLVAAQASMHVLGVAVGVGVGLAVGVGEVAVVGANDLS